MVTATATREVILCAGSIGTPQILQLSGIGPGALLRQHGITPVHELPGVGANLQDHLQIRAVFKVQGVQTLNVLANSLWGKAKIGLEYALRQSGPMSMAPSQLGAFTRSDPAQPYPNIEYHVQPLSLDAFGEPLHAFPAFTASVCNLNPTSRGTVQIKSARFEDAPAIAPNYLSTDEDRKVAADSLRLTRKIIAQPALARFKPEEFRPGVQFQSDEELARLAGDIASTIFHPIGTTKMGRADDPMAVVDSRLRVRGIAGLRIVDAGRDAHHHQRQHQQPGADDGREGGALDHGGRGLREREIPDAQKGCIRLQFAHSQAGPRARRAGGRGDTLAYQNKSSGVRPRRIPRRRNPAPFLFSDSKSPFPSAYWSHIAIYLIAFSNATIPAWNS